MKKYRVMLLLLLLLSGTLLAQNKQNGPAASDVLKSLSGHWQKGVFSLTAFEEPNGKYVGPANETSVSYVIDESGTAREYFISNTNTYNCRTQIMGYRTGKIVVNPADNSFEFQPASGYYTTLSCMSKSTTKKPYTVKDLYPDYKVRGYLETGTDGLPVLVTLRADSTKGLHLKKLN